MFNKDNLSIQAKMEKLFINTCRTWQNCTESNIKAFLEQCQENNIDPQFCMGWVEQHKSQIPEWQAISNVSLEWINQHTSTGSPISLNKLDPL
ncbi:hypothetical protein ACQKCU_24720 [Heyndrickxia sporothermodurans]